MNDELTRDLLHALFFFRRSSATIFHSTLNANGGGLSVAELSALGCIRNCNENDCDVADTADQTVHYAMHETLAVSKAAISQMLGSLEKRGYIQREINRDNRRKIIITVTKKGKTAVDKGGKYMDALMSRVIKRFGEDDARNFVQLLTRFTEIVDEEVGKTD
jgi:DNA-binding MarR family transcriptional regulator